MEVEGARMEMHRKVKWNDSIWAARVTHETYNEIRRLYRFRGSTTPEEKLCFLLSAA